MKQTNERKKVCFGEAHARPAACAFTIVEILIVMSLILVLAGLVLTTSSYVHNNGARSRAETEIAAMSSALENYKADNGLYPSNTSVDARTQGNPTQYQGTSTVLYQKLIGDTNNDGQSDIGVRSYMTFNPNQLGGSGPTTFVKDPFGNSYGYSTAGQAGSGPGYNPTFDLWSTGGDISLEVPPNQSKWIKNW